MTWRRHRGDSMFHTGRDDSGSFVTLCQGRWPLLDEIDGLVERNENPPHADRCDECQRRRIDIMRVEEGLRELRDSATYAAPARVRVVAWPSFDLSDVVGGEG